MSLSICLVTRNEEKNIERALRSVAGLADEVLVADTGSTDRTLELAAALGAKIVPFAWRDDFSAARNFIIGKASGDWIFWMNPDEELFPASRTLIPHCLQREDALGFAIRVRDLVRANRQDIFTETIQPRLFRRDSGARYRSRLHPSLEVPIEELARRQGKIAYVADVVLLRHAYMSVLTREKLLWAAHLFELELRDRPGQIHFLIEYGKTLLLLNDGHGHVPLAEAVEQIIPVRNAPSPPNTTVGVLLEYLLTVSPEQSRSPMTRAEAMELAMRWFRRSPPVVWAVTLNLFQTGDFAGAAALLEDLLRMGRTGEFDHSSGFDPDVMGAPALMNLGICYVKLNDLDKAQGCFGQLLTHPALQNQARQNFAMVQNLRAGRTASAPQAVG